VPHATAVDAQLTALMTHLEEQPMGVPPRHVYEILIRTTPERLWRAITDPADTQLYYYGTKVQSDWKPGSRLVYLDGDQVTLDCKIVEIEAPNRLVHTFTMVYDPEMAAERPSRVSWVIEKQGETCRLTLVHDDFEGETRTYREVEHGWPDILSGLKTLLETGEPLHIGQEAEMPA
jgi:uncharacterized protein YndB with AHSA1/START domain